MKKQTMWILILVVAAVVVMALLTFRMNSKKSMSNEVLRQKSVFLVENLKLNSTAGRRQEKVIRSLVEAGRAADNLDRLTIDYPLDESIFPPEIIAPVFLWSDDSEKVDTWLIDIALKNDTAHIYVLAPDNPLPPPEIDMECFNATDKDNPPLPPFQFTSTNWTPDDEVWRTIKDNTVEEFASITFFGFNSASPDKVLSGGRVTIKTSKDPVGAPIFYRDVPMIGVRRKLEDELEGIIAPIPPRAIDMITWRLRDISRPESRLVLKDMPTCANCHSFSADGTTLGMDIDGPAGDKGSYAIADIARQMVIGKENIISWNYSYKKKFKSRKKTIGFLSQLSPSGEYTVTTLNEAVFVCNYRQHDFIQVFYPTRGVFGYYSKELDDIMMLPGADNPDYVHCDPAWSSDSSYLVFARAEACDPNIEGQPRPEYANDPNERPIKYDLYKIPFNDGKGGKAVPVEGASNNGMSNNFPKVSPDGKWIVFVKCNNGQLMRPDGKLWIVPAEGGEARLMKCNKSLMNSWHSFSPNSRWLAFSSKGDTPYTQLYLTHIDENGNDSPAIHISNTTAPNRAINIPEFVNIPYDGLVNITVPAVEYRRHHKRAIDLGDSGKFKEALEELQLALKEEPDDLKIHWDIHHRTGLTLQQFGDMEEAVKHWKEAIRIDPTFSEPFFLIAIWLANEKKFSEANEYFEKTVEVAPKHPRAFYYLAKLRIEPEAPELYDPGKAIEYAGKVCELTYNKEPIMLEMLAWAYAANGQFKEALKTAESALEFARPRGIKEHIKRIEEKIELYKQGKAS